MLNFLFGKDTDSHLMKQQDFTSSYQLITKTCFAMGEENPPILISSVANIDLEQIIEKKKIFTTVIFKDMTSETDNNQMQSALQEMQLFTTVNPVIKFQRNLEGKVKGIANKEQLWRDWEKWKTKQLPQLIPDEDKQKKVIENYENGLSSLEDSISSNIQYMLLLPECYEFKDYPNAQDVCSYRSYHSRLIENMNFNYQLKKQKFSTGRHQPLSKLSLTSHISGQEDIVHNYLTPYYTKYLPSFSHEDYLFQVKIDYEFDKNTSEIMSATLSFTEQLHSNFTYSMEMELVRKE